MKFWADENFRGDILRGILTIYPNLDIIRVQDTSLIQIKDPDLLEEAAKVGAILLSHDIKTIPTHANNRVAQGKLMPGVVIIHQLMPLKQAIDGLSVMIGAGNESDFINQVQYL